ncbi:MAG: DUF2809 domain-containing protein [Chloroflexota bacterium]
MRLPNLPKVKRNIFLYISIILFLLAIGLPSRIFQGPMPSWYVSYTGDFVWAMMVFFMFALIFRLSTWHAFWVALATTYLIEVTQLFHPDWLEYLRTFRLFGLVFGYSFIWSDIVAYTLGISLGSILDWFILKAK